MNEEMIMEWNPWWTGDFDLDYVEREIEGRIRKWCDRRQVIPITGCRRSGKTTMMYIIIRTLLETVPRENILFIKCDDDRIQEGNVIEDARNKHVELFNPVGKIFIFLDEVQELDNWERTVKRIYDLETDVKIFLTGSRLLKSELSTSLAGRFVYFDMYPFSFREYLSARKIEIGDEIRMISRKNEIRHCLREYLQWGGFPEIILEDEPEMKKELLKFYSDSILYRDVIKRSNIKKADKVEKLKSYLLANISNLHKCSRIAEHLGISPDTVSGYLHAMEEAYFFFSVPFFSFSLRSQQFNPKKIYCVDTGIRNSAGFRFSSDMGRLYENLVFMHLKRIHNEIYYWKYPAGEVDFLLKDEQRISGIIQVCYDVSAAERREVRSLLAALDQFGLEKGTIITGETKEQRKIEGKTIEFIPLWEWLLFSAPSS